MPDWKDRLAGSASAAATAVQVHSASSVVVVPSSSTRIAGTLYNGHSAAFYLKYGGLAVASQGGVLLPGEYREERDFYGEIQAVQVSGTGPLFAEWVG